MSETNGNRRILCVDDESHALEGLERTLFEDFDVSTAASAAIALEVVGSEGPFAVVVSDMRMPEMDGAAFLSRVRESAPDTVRVLLTGEADVDAAIAAVNEGNVFRFLCKPCPQEVLLESLEAAADQYRLVTAERELLDNTLKGAVNMLVDVLSLTSPLAFSRSNQIKAYAAHIVKHLGIKDSWKYELAALQSQIGCITLLPETMDKVYAGQPISTQEQQMFDEHPEVAHRLLAHIPRLEEVAAMIKGQREAVPASTERKLGADILRVALSVDRLVAREMSVREAARELEGRPRHERKLLAALSDFRQQGRSQVVEAVNFQELRSSMILDQDVMSKTGNIVVGKGRVLNVPLIERLRNFYRGVGIVEPIRVRIPSPG